MTGAIQFKFAVLEMVVAPHLNGLTDVVKTITWQCVAQDDTLVASAYGTVSLDAPQGEFVSYEDLTEAMVLEWLENTLTGAEKSDTFSSLERDIFNQRSPVAVTKSLPWANP
jgi:hypothetical protein